MEGKHKKSRGEELADHFAWYHGLEKRTTPLTPEEKKAAQERFEALKAECLRRQAEYLKKHPEWMDKSNQEK